MPFSHHSHSGQFCGHATNTLEEVVQDAIRKGMTSFCMTEHIPRDEIDFYEEEVGLHTPETLRKLFHDFHHEAKRLKIAYKDQINLFIGFEGECIRETTSNIMKGLLENYDFDLFLGSVHHTHTVPIDMDAERYERARALSGGTDDGIFQTYFDDQLAMLRTFRPPVVGHFDLIRLRSDDANRSFKTWPAVWEKIVRNLRFIADYGGVIELNSSSLRKGMTEAYPQVEICREFSTLGGRFTLSDDSHGIHQVGLNYNKVLACVKKAGIAELYYLAPASESVKASDARFPKVGWKSVSVSELEKHQFWHA